MYKILKPFEKGLFTGLIIKDLTQVRLKEVLKYNFETGLFVWITPPNSRSRVGAIAGSNHPSGYRRLGIDGKQYLEHRLVWLYIHGEFPNGDKPFIDHIDGNPSNNRIENLRDCSAAENQRNTKKPLTNSSGFKGVHVDAQGMYRAMILNPITGKNEYLGSYLTPEDASIVYEKKSKDYSGVFYPDKLLNKQNPTTLGKPL